ncbi:hypothetical protein [Streptomyces mirabilis]|uniref:hypothetical protein n=1 Tax=Streptomyces mirabilis TaxID=68239 RepID=UPI0037FA7100
MTDLVSVDPDRLEQLTLQFQKAGKDLAEYINRYTQNCSGTDTGYGTLPVGRTAADQHAQGNQDMLTALHELQRRYEDQVDALTAATAAYRAGDDANKEAVSRLRPAL